MEYKLKLLQLENEVTAKPSAIKVAGPSLDLSTYLSTYSLIGMKLF